MNDALSDDSSRLFSSLLVSSRLVALEMCIAHQVKTIAEMNDAITAKWQTIDALQRHVAELRKGFRDIAPCAQPRSLPRRSIEGR